MAVLHFLFLNIYAHIVPGNPTPSYFLPSKLKAYTGRGLSPTYIKQQSPNGMGFTKANSLSTDVKGRESFKGLTGSRGDSQAAVLSHPGTLYGPAAAHRAQPPGHFVWTSSSEDGS